MRRLLMVSVAACLVSGCAEIESTKKKDVSGDGAAAQANKKEKPKKKEGGSIIGKKTREVVDARAAVAENPKLQRMSTDVDESDPLSQAVSVYTKKAAFVGSLGIQQWLKQEKTLNDRYPTHAQLISWMEKNGVSLPLLSPNQKYAYDDQTGELFVLEDPTQ